MKPKERCDLVSAGCEGLPEEVAAACLALSLGEGNVSPYHLLPDSHLLLLLPLWRREHHPPVFGRHEFGEKLEQEQVSEVLTEGSDRNHQWQTSVSPCENAQLATLTWSSASSELLRISATRSLRGAPLTCGSSSEESSSTTRRMWTCERSIFTLRSRRSHSQISVVTLALQSRTQQKKNQSCSHWRGLLLCGTCEADKLVSSSPSPPHPQATQGLWLVGGGMRRCHQTEIRSSSPLTACDNGIK